MFGYFDFGKAVFGKSFLDNGLWDDAKSPHRESGN
jgi:hypothetical protein